MEQLPWYVTAIFIGTIILATWLFVKATHYSRMTLMLTSGWTCLQIILGISGFYRDPASLAGRFPLLVVPPIIILVSLFVTRKGRSFIDGLDLPALTIFHIIRLPVEITLLFLFINHTIPKAMTIEGRNYDILSGLSAPILYYLVFIKKDLGKPVLIIWNFVCIGLLLNVVIHAVLSLPGRSVGFGFEQPNIAVGHLPYILLPALIVPMALFCNAAAIMQLLRQKSKEDH